MDYDGVSGVVRHDAHHTFVIEDGEVVFTIHQERAATE